MADATLPQATPSPARSGGRARRTAGLSRWFHRRGWMWVVIAVPYVWLLLLFLVPFGIVAAMSVATQTATAPPFAWGGEHPWINLASYDRLLTDGLYLRAFLTSVLNAAAATVLCLLIGYPMALAIARSDPAWRGLLLMLVILPFWTSFLLRVYAWMGLLATNSWANRGLTSAWNAVAPAAWEVPHLALMNSNFATVLVIVYSYLPFMILPLYATLERLDTTLDEAAMDLGSRPGRVFLDVTLPLSVPGIIAGALLVFIPACGELVVPSLVGDASHPMIGRLISDDFGQARDWPMASATAVALLLLLVGPLMVYSWAESRSGEAPRAAR